MNSYICLWIVCLPLFAAVAFAEVPPPGTSRSGTIIVTPDGLGAHEYSLKTHKTIPRADSRAEQISKDKLRRRIKELEAENEALRNRPAFAPAPIVKEKTVERLIEKKTIAPFTVYALAGTLPDGVHVERKDLERKAQVHEYGPALGLGGMYHFENGVSLGAQGSVTTRDTHLQSYFGTLGYSFGSR